MHEMRSQGQQQLVCVGENTGALFVLLNECVCVCIYDDLINIANCRHSDTVGFVSDLKRETPHTQI